MNYNKNILRNILRIAIILTPIAFQLPHFSPRKYPDLIGKYEVKSLTMNGISRPIDLCNDSTISHVYFDLNNDFVFEYNHFKRMQLGNLVFDETTRQMRCTWKYPKNLSDTLIATLSPIGKDSVMTLKGKMGNNTLDIELVKVKSLRYFPRY